MVCITLAIGGAGHKVILLMEGEANCYVMASPGCKKWDTCAPEGIIDLKFLLILDDISRTNSTNSLYILEWGSFNNHVD